MPVRRHATRSAPRRSSARLLAAPFLAVLVVTGGCAARHPVIRVAPPAVRGEVRPPSPGRDFLWVPGRWEWRDHRHVWTSGRWIPPRPGQIWVPGHWKRLDAGWTWEAGRWDAAG